MHLDPFVWSLHFRKCSDSVNKNSSFHHGQMLKCVSCVLSLMSLTTLLWNIFLVKEEKNEDL